MKKLVFINSMRGQNRENQCYQNIYITLENLEQLSYY